ncbi:MAG: YeeE/YedE family protein [Hyphomicrobium sp.]
MTAFTPIAATLGGVLIGLAAVALMATTGRIAGVSGFISRMLPPFFDDQFTVRLAFVGGLIAAPVLAGAIGLGTLQSTVSNDTRVLVAAGLLVGFGAVIGSGCTSGHGVCGMARLSPRSLVATAVFMAAAMITVFVSRHVLGG